MVKAKTVDLMVPADSEIVIEGLISTELLEPEGPFGESTGYVALEDYNLSMEVTAITHRSSPVFASIISQVTPSESSVYAQGGDGAAVSDASAPDRHRRHPQGRDA